MDTKAMTNMMAESYPHLKQPRRDKSAFTDAEYRDRLSKLQNRLSCARNWHALQQKCSPGILALVPCGGVSDPDRLVGRTLHRMAIYSDFYQGVETT